MSALVQITAEEFVQRAFEMDLLDEHLIRSIWAEFGTTSVTFEDFQQFLLRRGILTNYQVDRLLRDERTGFYYGDYKVLYRIGSGAFARAYRAVHRETGQVVAIKVLRSRFADDPEVTGQFCREGAIGNLLRHPNIVPIYEVVSRGETHFLVMEFLEGRTLREFLKIRQRFDPPEAVRLMIDVASGLSYAADRGITHRDLKASNVIITSEGQAKLLDFGLAAVADNAGSDRIDSGPNPRTIDYVGLERVTGVRKNDPRSDIYFAGCIFYHMLTGQPALRETTDRMQRLLTTRYTQVAPAVRVAPDLPESLFLILGKSMALDVERRYQHPGEMLADLQDAAQQLAERHGDGDGSESDRNEVSAAAAGNGGEGIGNDRILDSGLQATVDRVAKLPGNGSQAAADRGADRRKVIMVVESNAMMREVFRQAFSDSGYRVLIESDPQAVFTRFGEDEAAAHGVLFCCGDLGEPALEAFNRFGQDGPTARVPAVLLLAKNQKPWQGQAEQSAHRLVVATPMRVRQLREVVARLVPPQG